MPLTRREFFTRLAAAAAVATVAPAIITKAIESFASSPVLETVNGNAAFHHLTFAAMEEMYQTCCYGNEEPNMILMPRNLYAEFVKHIPELQRFSREDAGFTSVRFEGADVTYADNLAENEVAMINTRSLRRDFVSNHPETYSGIFTLPELKWRALA